MLGQTVYNHTIIHAFNEASALRGHGFYPCSYELVDKQKQNTLTTHLRKTFLMRWLPRVNHSLLWVNIRCTNCTALGTLGTYVQGVFWLWHHKELKYHEYQGHKI